MIMFFGAQPLDLLDDFLFGALTNGYQAENGHHAADDSQYAQAERSLCCNRLCREILRIVQNLIIP